jgi:hypothetical protein
MPADPEAADGGAERDVVSMRTGVRTCGCGEAQPRAPRMARAKERVTFEVV